VLVAALLKATDGATAPTKTLSFTRGQSIAL